ncbi:MAG TPA: LLM class flavin-dependent oxidoreductase [Solirubrobacteraceae bacterium]|nr:LLM class flavin-dependent oxidoreductase [Solirubrobacteraceae bacterium]
MGTVETAAGGATAPEPAASGAAERRGSRLGIGIPACASAADVAEVVAQAESAGLDSAWFLDAQLIWRDVYATMALAAVRTSRIVLVPGIALTTARHPTVVASGINTVQELAPGRVGLGLGTGGLGYFLGTAPRRLHEPREDVMRVRALLAGEQVDYRQEGGYLVHLIGAAGTVPIYLSGGGPKVAELAGEVADGIILSVGTSPSVLRRALASVQVGLERSGRTLDDFDVACTYFMHLTDDLERDLRLLKPTVCALASNTAGKQPSPFSAALFAEAGADMPDPAKRPSGFFPAVGFAPDREEAARLCQPAVADEVALRLASVGGLFGSADEIGRRLAAMSAAGADHHWALDIDCHRLPGDDIDVLGQLRRAASWA